MMKVPLLLGTLVLFALTHQGLGSTAETSADGRSLFFSKCRRFRCGRQQRGGRGTSPPPPPPTRVSAPTIRRTIIDDASDDFEDPSWSFDFATEESSNGKWNDGLRALPSVIRRVPTPQGGRPGSSGSLLLRARPTSESAEQNDFLAEGYKSAVGVPSFTKDDLPLVSVNVFIPNLRSLVSNSFAMRLQVLLPDGNRLWPGIIVQGGGFGSASLLVRTQGGDRRAGRLAQSGWHTFAMGLDDNGRVVYYHRVGAARNGEISSRDEIARSGGSLSNVELESHWFALVARRGRDSPSFYLDNVEVGVVDDEDME